MQGIQKGQIRNVSFQSGKVRRYWPGQVLFSWNDTWRRISLSFASSPSSFLSVWAARNRRAFTLWITDWFVRTYVRTYWPDAPRVTHTCVARSLKHRIASTIRKRKRKRARERDQGRTGQEDGPRDWKEGKRNDQEWAAGCKSFKGVKEPLSSCPFSSVALVLVGRG